MSEAANTVRTATGKVVGNKANKTITVLIERRVKHPVYGKYITRSSKIHAHDENNECNMGDLVTVAETRPISKLKTWKLLKVEESVAQV
jgi:small subunit ribosomal protein S17